MLKTERVIESVTVGRVRVQLTLDGAGVFRVRRNNTIQFSSNSERAAESDYELTVDFLNDRSV